MSESFSTSTSFLYSRLYDDSLFLIHSVVSIDDEITRILPIFVNRLGDALEYYSTKYYNDWYYHPSCVRWIFFFSRRIAASKRRFTQQRFDWFLSFCTDQLSRASPAQDIASFFFSSGRKYWWCPMFIALREQSCRRRVTFSRLIIITI